MNEVKTPPNSTEAERAILGAILVDTYGRNSDRVMDLCLSSSVTAAAFFNPRNRTIFAAMVEMNRLSKPLDPVSLIEYLKSSGTYEMSGGEEYIQALIDHVPTTAHAEYYIELLLAKHLRRVLIERSTNVIEKCYDEREYPDSQAILGDAERTFLEIGVSGSSTMSWQSALELSMNRIDSMFDSNGKKLEGLSTGLKHLDEKLQGLKPSEMIVIAARPSVGKTSLAMNIAESAAMGQMLTAYGDERSVVYRPVESDNGKKHPVLIFSLEMPVEALTKRMITGRARVNAWRLNRGLCAASEKDLMFNRLTTATGELKSAPIYVDDTAGLDIMDLRARARRMKKQHGIELIVIDYLQLCSCREGARLGGRQIEVSMISGQVKAMAKELKIPVIVLSQLSRNNEQRGDKFERPKLSDLRDSGAIEQDADVVFLLRRPSRTPSDPESNDPTLAYIDVAKNRNGEIGDVKVNFEREYTRFSDRALPANEAQEAEAREFENQTFNQPDLT
ncbi:MAG: replicative DNA helicase [Kiritimatiellae bacterium]|nr:replicative DNA helicase [Kiritimatiellia bacterium]